MINIKSLLEVQAKELAREHSILGGILRRIKGRTG
jgi:hypothetical protein